MKYLTLSTICLMILSSCIFTNTSDKTEPVVGGDDLYSNIENIQYGDSIMVDTIIGDFRLYYKISEVVDTTFAVFSCDEDNPNNDVLKRNKSILLNIQKLDTTSVVNKKRIDVQNFAQAISELNADDYILEEFYLKEVKNDSVVFEAKLCMFGKDICRNVDLEIGKDGSFKYQLLNKQITQK